MTAFSDQLGQPCSINGKISILASVINEIAQYPSSDIPDPEEGSAIAIDVDLFYSWVEMLNGCVELLKR